MKIVIAGAGEVGTHLAKMLSGEDQDIVLIDTDEARLVKLENYNLMPYQGSAVSMKTLRQLEVGDADLFIAVTPHESRNVVACAMAKKLGAKKVVARIENYDFLRKENGNFFQGLGVDTLIYPEYFAAQEMVTAIKHTWVRNWFELFDGQLIVVGVKLRSSKLIGHKLREVSNISSYLHVSAIKRNRETIIPRGDDEICAGDIVYIATTDEHMDDVIAVCGKESLNVRKVFINGGNKIAVQFAKMVGDSVKVKIVDSDMERCQYLSDALPDCSIVHGDARSVDFLEEEGLGDYDIFAALSDSSEANILSCLMAKDHGIRKTIAEVEDIPFISEAESLNIGTVINKKLLASSRIFQIMLDSDVNNSKCLALADAEVAELLVKEGTKVTKKPVKDLDLSRDMTIAGMVRDGEGYLVTGNTQLQAGDHVVVFCLSGAIHNIEKIFSR